VLGRDAPVAAAYSRPRAPYSLKIFTPRLESQAEPRPGQRGLVVFLGLAG